MAESAAYSVLQSGTGVRGLAGRPTRRGPSATPARGSGSSVDDGTLVVTLTRPARLNALDAQMRDELVEALTLAAADPSITRRRAARGGTAFCAGGDLDEFGIRVRTRRRRT